MSLIEQLNKIFQTVFDDETISITPDMTANDIDGWDSLSHVNLITAIETKFNIRFTQKELLTQRNIGNLLSDIDRILINKNGI